MSSKEDPKALTFENEVARFTSMLARSLEDYNYYAYSQAINSLIGSGLGHGRGKAIAAFVRKILEVFLQEDSEELLSDFRETFASLLRSKITCPLESKVYDPTNVGIFLAHITSFDPHLTGRINYMSELDAKLTAEDRTKISEAIVASDLPSEPLAQLPLGPLTDKWMTPSLEDIPWMNLKACVEKKEAEDWTVEPNVTVVVKQETQRLVVGSYVLQHCSST
ncbi:hypothetical protein DFP72DRAFT_1069281 [Ephemerocybe angulata]|uniref:Uncharacterized protein n=1 Tax=Ephemerocybe angulata TaxID=980116 RepID=A0A8H6HVN2_9AGAR|nr:hypothetical protein DFP72DRAFT_1069281 [Tulosesus angulatus]